MNCVWKSVLVILSLNCVPRLCATDGDAAQKRFRVVQRNDVRFTDKADEVNVKECVFPPYDRLVDISF